MAQRMQFLEAKGLTGPEIDVALKQASVNQTAPQLYQAPYTPGYGPSPYSTPPSHSWDWRDYFVRLHILKWNLH